MDKEKMAEINDRCLKLIERSNKLRTELFETLMAITNIKIKTRMVES